MSVCFSCYGRSGYIMYIVEYSYSQSHVELLSYVTCMDNS